MIVQNEKKLHVLLADDDSDDHLIFNEAILHSKMHLEFSYAEDGRRLLKVLENDVIADVLFRDINIPNMNGIECLKVIRSNARFKNLHIIIYSTADFKPTNEKCYEYVVNLFILKPSSFNELIKDIEPLGSVARTSTLTSPTSDLFNYQTLI